MAKASQLSELKIALDDHQEVTKEQIHRLRDIFSNLGQNPEGVVGKAMKGPVRENEDKISNAQTGPVRDAVIINLVQQVKDQEITEYEKARAHAADLGRTRIVELLDKTINEERAMNLHLNEMAQNLINANAPGDTNNKSNGAEVTRFIDEGNPNIQESQ
jgi:ferritin-like metal-binding protein YciE